MNLNAVVAGVVGSVNPQVPALVKVSRGPAPTAADGGRVPTYSSPVPVLAQVQPLSTGDLRKLEGINLQAVNRKIYLNGHVNGLVRVKNKGGDLVILGSETWLVKAVLEQWPWVCVAVVLQNDPPPPC